jgi:homoserine O-succinyltransferase
MFVFFQGHPEYDPGALYREYRRDVGRFLSGTMDSYPEMPRGYFAADRARAFTEFRARAHRQRTRELLADFPVVDSPDALTPLWRDAAVRLYANWLTILAERALRGTERVGPNAGLPARHP